MNKNKNCKKENKAIFQTIKTFSKLASGALFVFSFLFFPQESNASALLLNQTSGTFVVGSTFDVSIMLDTEGKSVNALDVNLKFPPDKLQLVSPKTSVSVISVWTSQPKFNNQTGDIRLQGGIPKGVNLSNALVATFTFRVKSVGSAIVSFSDQSKVLLNDGLGTDDLSRRGDAVYQLILPPPAGPIVVSETHPNQSEWYSNSTAILSWANNVPVEGYSYILNDEPVSIVDDTVDSNKTQVAYRNLSDGRHYFHIKALKNGVWGGVTHFALKVDTTGPAEYIPDVLPRVRTTVKQPIIKFETTDSLSGLDHYEIRIISLDPKNKHGLNGDQEFFIETESPYIPSALVEGPYSVIVRAFDKAGNQTESVVRVEIIKRLFSFIGDDGIVVKNWFVIPWVWFWLICLVLLCILGFVAVSLKKRHDRIHEAHSNKELPSDVRSKLEELRKFREKYGSVVASVLFIASVFGFNQSAYSANLDSGFVEMPPPLITTISKNITNEDIFYVGGKTNTINTEIVLYVQNLSTGETYSYDVVSDKDGNWFYRHDSFVSAGSYLLWTQGKLGEQLSPPSPQIQLVVKKTALQFGVSRISYDLLYLLLMIAFGLIVIYLILHIVYHSRAIKKKHARLMKEIREAEESVKRGFAVLKRDIQAELSVIKKAQMDNVVGAEHKEKEERLLKDLESIEKHIGKEIWDVEEAEFSN